MDTKLKPGDKIKVISYSCGKECTKRLKIMGVLPGKEIIIEEMQPLKGPLVLSIDNSKIAIGRGLFEKIIYEEIK